MSLKSNDIHPLYARALSGDTDALDAMSDEIGRLSGLEWKSPDQEAPHRPRGWHTIGKKHDTLDLWRVHGHHAPCVSHDCALSAMPEGYNWDKASYIKGSSIVPLRLTEKKLRRETQMEWRPIRAAGSIACVEFHYTAPAQLPIALTAAALYAHKHKEANDAKS